MNTYGQQGRQQRYSPSDSPSSGSDRERMARNMSSASAGPGWGSGSGSIYGQPQQPITTAQHRQSFAHTRQASRARSLVPSVYGGRLSPSIRPGTPNSANIPYLEPPTPTTDSPHSRANSLPDLAAWSAPTTPTLPVGGGASLLGHARTLDMYRANAKKTGDPAIQFEFACFMIDAAREMSAEELSPTDPSQAKSKQNELIKEAAGVLRRLADRGHVNAQYFLGDCYATGVIGKNDADGAGGVGMGKPDLERAFPLFVLAAKHGHAEASWRVGLSYEYGWGCKRDPHKAVQFLTKSATANHPGAMLRLGKAHMAGDLALKRDRRDGVKWLKRAAEAASVGYASAPYELGLLHLVGVDEANIFKDEQYAAQLFTKAAELGHVEAAFRLGEAYEYGRLGLHPDAGLSIHFYAIAAQEGTGHSGAMLALCAWCMVGALPSLPKDEALAFEWALKAAEAGNPKAEYAVGYFLEIGIGRGRDVEGARGWYARAIEHGDERAVARLNALNVGGQGSVRQPIESSESGSEGGGRVRRQKEGSGGKKEKQEKDCVIM
ncbi:Chitin synthase 4 [Saitoella coloradoensis]